ncbi:hypothetical protein [Mycoplasmopsis canis]|uniref:hypothetical protein n=1 Tax=Mycoplasmopsis canis TaxID=29555 RepID=UPI0002D5B9F2|nr:hypothetical protein [Mycoplasmopsis canis]
MNYSSKLIDRNSIVNGIDNIINNVSIFTPIPETHVNNPYDHYQPTNRYSLYSFK